MQFIKKSARKSPKVSLVLLDWSVRESFHVLHYLSKQTVDRDTFEVIIIEYYDRVSGALKKFEDQVDTWVTLDMPKDCYYHKHYMYNVGITLAQGEIVMIGDSDAMVKPTFIETIIRNFREDPEIVYHMDQFRNVRRDLYPFNYPTFEEVLGEGAINNSDGVTTGVLEVNDPVHARNYGACMCALRKDLIAIGGADMHIDYLGHICGPYDMTFRLMNFGRREVWDMKEFTYHTWHPGQAGADNYLGPHDGRHMSTTALEAMSSGRVAPLLESPAVAALRAGKSREEALAVICPEHYLRDWNVEALKSGGKHLHWGNYKRPMGLYKGFRLIAEVDRVFAFPVTEKDAESRLGQGYKAPFEGGTVEEVRTKIDAAIPILLRVVSWLGKGGAIARRAVAGFWARAKRLPIPVPAPLRPIILLPVAPFGLLLLVLFHRQRLRDKLAAVNNELESITVNSNQLAVALFNVKKWGKLPDENGILIVEGQAARDYLGLLQRFRLIPGVDIAMAPDSERFEALLRQLELGEARHRLLLSSALHARFHSMVMGSKLGKQCLVL